MVFKNYCDNKKINKGVENKDRMDSELYCQYYKHASSLIGLKLGLADKLLLYNLMRENDYEYFDDIMMNIQLMFDKFGYDNTAIVHIEEKERKHESAMVAYWLRRANQTNIVR